MSHLNSTDRDRIVARIRRIAGQVSALERAATAGAPCAETLHLAAAVRGAVGGLMDALVAEHLHEHVAAETLTPEQRRDGAEELARVLQRHFR
jgi:DNA-binding FrmR family transcriptional regulator